MSAEALVRTQNGTFVTKEVAKAAGLEVKAERKAATRKKTTAKKTKAATAAKKTPTRKAAGVARRKGK